MPSGDRTVRLDIGGVILHVDGLSGVPLRWARRRYRPFLTTRRAGVSLVMTPTRRRLPMIDRPSLAWTNGTFELAVGRARVTGDWPSGPIRIAMPARETSLAPVMLRQLASLLLFQRDGFLLHAAAVVTRGRALLFSGPSGSGKTTVARLAGRRRVLNDDTVAVRDHGGRFVACATPFFGEAGPAMAARNVTAPLGALFFLTKANGFAHRRLTAPDVVARALPQVFLPKRHPAIVERLLAVLPRLAECVPCYDLAFTPTRALWDYVDGLA
ncbi:MAG: hypothetical protein HYU41_20415 [Candidatus Rokubacteria bacterium]|nr:hypothetical protein [Candidatus Rokubacteria bacterium]